MNKKTAIMNIIYKIQKFLILAGVFSVGLFGGEWLIDILLEIPRGNNFKEIIESIFIGFIVAILWRFKKRK